MAGKPNDKIFKTMVNKLGSEEAVRNYYRELGRKGGSVKGTKKGFASNPELARIVGEKGGRISRRGKAKKEA